MIPIDISSTRILTELLGFDLPSNLGVLSFVIEPEEGEVIVTVIVESIMIVIGAADAVFPTVSITVAVIV